MIQRIYVFGNCRLGASLSALGGPATLHEVGVRMARRPFVRRVALMGDG